MNRTYSDLRELPLLVKEKKQAFAADTPYVMIDTPQELAAHMPVFEKAPILAADMEADSMFHFREKICLVQLSTGRFTAVVDPLAVTDLGALGQILADPGVMKVFHGADYDVRSLYRDFQFEIHNLFDTELACRFLGMSATSLEKVLQHYFKVQLNKKFQKKDWSQRPLPAEMVAYAADDVSYLVPLARKLRARLKQKGRLAWVEEECERLSRVRPLEDNGDPLFLKFKGAGRLDRRGLALLEALLQARRHMALRRDMPPFKIISHEVLKKLVLARPSTMDELKQSGILSARQIQLFGKELLSAICGALRLSEKRLPSFPRQKPRHLSRKANRRLGVLKEWRDQKAAGLKIDPCLLLTKAHLKAIAETAPQDAAGLAKIPDIRQWQILLLGEEVLDLLHGA